MLEFVTLVALRISGAGVEAEFRVPADWRRNLGGRVSIAGAGIGSGARGSETVLG